jgi:hypothetical protein
MGRSHRDLRGNEKRRGGGGGSVEYVDFNLCCQCVRKAQDLGRHGAWGKERIESLRFTGSELMRWKAIASEA